MSRSTGTLSIQSHPYIPYIKQKKKFAYNESSFFLIRLLQNFSFVSLSEESQPPDSRAPQIWKLDAKGGRKSKEKIQPKSHLTMFLKVMFFLKEKAHATLSFPFLFLISLFLNMIFFRVDFG